MRRQLSILLGGLVLALAAPLAHADEALAGCEPGQGPPGGAPTRPVGKFIDAFGRPLYACEGEHWDGQDPVDPSAGSDPNDFDGDTIALRASRDGAEQYASAHASSVGVVALYAGACVAGGPGLEGDASCDGTAQARVGLYVRDETPGNLAWTAVSALRLTHAGAGEGDCTHDEYERPPSAGGSCWRDNTALTLEALLP